MSGANVDRIASAGMAVALAIALVPQPAVARSVACWRNIMCAAGQAVVEGLVKRGLEGSKDAGKVERAPAPGPPTAPSPPQRSEQPLPPERISGCEVVRECRVVAAGPCFRVSSTTIRCPRQRQCRVRRVCGRGRAPATFPPQPGRSIGDRHALERICACDPEEAGNVGSADHLRRPGDAGRLGDRAGDVAATCGRAEAGPRSGAAAPRLRDGAAVSCRRGGPVPACRPLHRSLPAQEGVRDEAALPVGRGEAQQREPQVFLHRVDCGQRW